MRKFLLFLILGGLILGALAVLGLALTGNLPVALQNLGQPPETHTSAASTAHTHAATTETPGFFSGITRAVMGPPRLTDEERHATGLTPDVHAAARDAVARLGPGRGGKALPPGRVIGLQRQVVSLQRQTASVQRSQAGLDANAAALARRQAELKRQQEALAAKKAEVAKKAAALGAKKTKYGYQLSLAGDVLFDFDKADIRTDAEWTLHGLLDMLKTMEWKGLVIAGHTDALGDDAYNEQLSVKRAISVGTWLVRREVPKSRIKIMGYGEQKPVAPNTHPDGRDNPEGRQKNRRVEVHIYERVTLPAAKSG